MRTWALVAVVLAGCGPVRMDSASREGGGMDQRLYTRDDPYGRASALESAGGDDCREARQGKWVMAMCPEPDKLRVGVPALLRFQVGEGGDGGTPVTGALIAVGLTHKGGREALLTHSDPVVSGVKETSPGNYEATAVFPAEGRWTVEAAVSMKDGKTVRLKLNVTVSAAPPPAVR